MLRGRPCPGTRRGWQPAHSLSPRRCPPSRACASCACCPSRRMVRGAGSAGGSATGLGLSSRQHPVPPGLNPKDYRSLKTQYLQVSLLGAPRGASTGQGIAACLLLTMGHQAMVLPRDVPAACRGWCEPGALPAPQGALSSLLGLLPVPTEVAHCYLVCAGSQGSVLIPVTPSPELWARALADLPQPEAHRAADRAGGWGDPDGCGEQGQQAGDRPSGW